jgi:fucose permease
MAHHENIDPLQNHTSDQDVCVCVCVGGGGVITLLDPPIVHHSRTEPTTSVPLLTWIQHRTQFSEPV